MMTIFAFELLYFIKYKRSSFFGDRLVAFDACHIFVFPVEREEGFVVIES